MCPAAAVSCIIHDVSEFSTSWCLSVSTACPLSLPIHSPWMVMTSQRAHSQLQKDHNSYRHKETDDTLTHIHTITETKYVLHVSTPQHTEKQQSKTGQQVDSPQTVSIFLYVSVCASVYTLPWRATVRCLMTGRQSATAAAKVVESLGRLLKAHRVLGVGSPDLVKAFPCSSTQLYFSSLYSSQLFQPHSASKCRQRSLTPTL